MIRDAPGPTGGTLDKLESISRLPGRSKCQRIRARAQNRWLCNVRTDCGVGAADKKLYALRTATAM